MRIFLVILGLIFFNDNLINYSNSDYHFEITLPKDFKIEKDKYEEKFAYIENIKISGSSDFSNGLISGTVVYRLICYKFAKKSIIDKDKLDFHKVVIAYSKHLNEKSLIKNDFQIQSTYEKKDTIFYILSNDSKGLIEHRKFIFHDSLTYCLSIMSNKSLLKTDYINDFFNSFKIK
jgi:hypothetical protein